MIETLVKEIDLTISIREVRLYSGISCVPGMRIYAEQQGLSLNTLLKTGLKASQLLAFNDVRATAVVIRKYQEEGYNVS